MSDERKPCVLIYNFSITVLDTSHARPNLCAPWQLGWISYCIDLCGYSELVSILTAKQVRIMEPKTDKRFHNLTSEQMQALDKVLTEVIPIYGRGNFPTLELRAKDIIRVVRDRLVEREIHVKDIRLNGATASHVMVRDNGMGYRDLDIIFGVELPRLEDFQVIKEVVLGSLRDFLPGGVNRRKITCLTMKEAYVQKMVKVFNEHDRWSLISLSNNRAKTVGLRFVSSLRRQFEFSVDSFQIILDRMLESYWETEKNQGGKLRLNNENVMNLDVQKTTVQPQQATPSECLQGDKGKDSKPEEKQCRDENVTVLKEDLPQPVADSASEEHRPENENVGAHKVPDDVKVNATKDIIAEVKGELRQIDSPSGSSAKNVVIDPLVKGVYPTLQNIDGELSESKASQGHTEKSGQRKVVQLQCEETKQYKAEVQSSTVVQESQLEFSFPPPAKKTCSMSQGVVPDYCPSPKLQRKMSRKLLSKPPPSEKWSLLTDLTDVTTQMFQPIEIPKATHPNQPSVESVQCLDLPDSTHKTSVVAESVLDPTCHPATTFKDGSTSTQTTEQTVKPKHYRKPLKPKVQSDQCTAISSIQLSTALDQKLGPTVSSPNSTEPWERAGGNPSITVQAECMYGDFEMAMDHLRLRVIATHNPEEIRGGGLLKYSDLLVRNFKPASETEIKSLERYMCSRFFIDFSDVTEQQRKIEAYLQCHFFGNEETSKYDYLMTLRRVIDESTVCLMGHERRQTLNMITVLALRVLGEQNAIPNTANVTCFYQPAPYMTEPIFSSYYIPQPQPQPPPLVYHPYPLQVHMQTGLV